MGPDSNGKPETGQLTSRLFKNFDVRIHDRNGEPWFIATDVCKILGIKNVSKAIAPLDVDEKATITISDSGIRPYFSLIISESGLYSLVYRSRKSEAKAFSKWVRSEVLPTLRKTGSYTMGQPPSDRQLPPPVATIHNLDSGPPDTMTMVAQTLANAAADHAAGLVLVSQTLAALATGQIETKRDVALVKEEVAETKADMALVKAGQATQAMLINDIAKSVPDRGYFTLASYAKWKNLRLDAEYVKRWGGRLKAYCRTHDVETHMLPDERWGHVNSYPLNVIELTFEALGPKSIEADW